MTEPTEDEQAVRLNQAFERLEKQPEPLVDKQPEPLANKQPEPLANKQQNKQPESEKSQKKPQPEIKPAGKWTSVLAAFLALVALGLGSYALYTSDELKQVAKSKAEENLALKGDIEAVKLSMAQLEQVSHSDNSTNEGQALLALEARFNQSLLEIKESIGSTSEDWLLAEADYLIRIANQRVKMERDPKGALVLFQAADEIIKESQGIAAFELRQALAKDILNLKNISEFDVDGIFLQIAALIKLVDKLQQNKLEFTMPVPPVKITAPQTFFERMMDVVSSAGNRIATLVDYRAKGEVVRPILPPKEAYYLRQNLVMKMQVAQLALLRMNQLVFEASLGEALAWVQQYFDAQDLNTITMSASLESLKNNRIDYDIPDVSGSLREMRKLMLHFYESSHEKPSGKEENVAKPDLDGARP